jgi:hypothetical protein
VGSSELWLLNPLSVVQALVTRGSNDAWTTVDSRLQRGRQISSDSGLTTKDKDKESDLHDMEDLLEIRAHFTLQQSTGVHVVSTQTCALVREVSVTRG